MKNNNFIVNNECVGELLKELKRGVQYKTLSKKEERDMIDKYLSEGKEGELRKMLQLHNIRMVFNIAKKYCKRTMDFDNMISRGLYGLAYAANKFNLFEPIMVNVKVGTKQVVDERGNAVTDVETGLPLEEPVYEKQVKIDHKTGNPDYIKFCTYAHRWIFKYVVDEFEKRNSTIIDNNSISIDDSVRIKNSTDNNNTVENYVDSMISPDYAKPSTIMETIEDGDVDNIYRKIGEYIKDTNELTALEKTIVVDTFYNGKKAKDIANEMSIKLNSVISHKNSALRKIKKYITGAFNIDKLTDIKV